MEHYTKASSHTVGSEEKKEALDIHVKSGSKIRNILAQAFRLLQNKKAEKIVLTGSGPTVTKTITCAEIIKRKTKGLHQLNKLFYTKIQDTWEPNDESLDKLQVTRKVPSISITLSKVPLDAVQPGYQAPGKSKSPVQFGDEDWELAWEETQDDSAKKMRTEKSGGKAKPKSKRTVDKGNTETKRGDQETLSMVASGSQEEHSGNGADGGQLKDTTCEDQQVHSVGGPLGCEKEQVGPLKVRSLESGHRLQGHSTDHHEGSNGVLEMPESGALENRQSRGWWMSSGGILEGEEKREIYQEEGK